MREYRDALGRRLEIRFNLGGFNGDIVCCELWQSLIDWNWIPESWKKRLSIKVYFNVLGGDGLRAFKDMTDQECKNWIETTIDDYNNTKLRKEIVKRKMKKLNGVV